MANHPDRGGDHETMAAINEAYHRALEIMDGATVYDADDNPHTYHYNRYRESEAIKVVSELLKHTLKGCEIWMIGTWVWVVGNTKQYREIFKKVGLRWHSKRSAWYWSPKSKNRRRYNPKVDLNGLADYYGGRVIEPEDGASGLQAA